MTNRPRDVKLRNEPSAALHAAARLLVRAYFRRVEVEGPVPSPGVRGRLVAANHVNALVDPILVVAASRAALSPLAKATLWNVPVLRALLDAAGAVPVVRRRDAPDKAAGTTDALLARVGRHLAAGGNVLVFPEGTSHDEPRLLPLRSGAGHMLARAAEDATPEAPLEIQAVALEFDAREVFRSRALVRFGAPVDVRAIARGAPGRPPLAGAELAAAVTARLAADLAEGLVEGRTTEERARFLVAGALYAERGALGEAATFARRIEAARARLEARGSDPRVARDVAAAEAAVDAYATALRAAGLEAVDVAKDAATWAANEGARRAGATLVVTAPLAAAGAALFWLPYQVPRLVARRLARTGDMMSTTKLVAGLLVLPTWALALVAGGTALLAGPLGASGAGALALLALGLGALVAASAAAALVWVDAEGRERALLQALAPPEVQSPPPAALVELRRDVLTRLEALRALAEDDAPAGRGP